MIQTNPENDPYQLVQESGSTLPLPGEVIVAPTVEQLLDQLAAELVVQAYLELFEAQAALDA